MPLSQRTSQIIRNWWPYLGAAVVILLAMIVGLFMPETLYVGLGVYITATAAVAFIIFAIFKWGAEESPMGRISIVPDIHTIKAGKHSSDNRRIWLHIGKKRHEFRFRIHVGAWYNGGDHINKLFGWSYWYHHHDSVRLGWKPTNIYGYYDLFLYVYNCGHRTIIPLVVVREGEWYSVKMDVASNGLFSASVVSGDITTTNSVPFAMPAIKFGYMLFPYLGGKPKAKNNTTITLIHDIEK